MILSFVKECKIVSVQDSVGAGKATSTGAVVDMAGYTGACFIYKLGTVVNGAKISLYVNQENASDGAFSTSIPDATAVIETASADSEKILVVDVLRPRERYLRPTVKTETQNVEVDWGLCVLYNPNVKPKAQPDNIKAATLAISPADA